MNIEARNKDLEAENARLKKSVEARNVDLKAENKQLRDQLLSMTT